MRDGGLELGREGGREGGREVGEGGMTGQYCLDTGTTHAKTM